MTTSPASGQERFMRRAIELAEQAVTSGKGRPFGAVIVRQGQVVAEGHNEVLHQVNPTAHAEIVVIGRATQALGNLDLSDCEIYINSTPCPMCATALLWSRIGRIYHALDADDAAEEGFDDRDLFVEMSRPIQERSVPAEQLPAFRTQARRAFELWRQSQADD